MAGFDSGRKWATGAMFPLVVIAGATLWGFVALPLLVTLPVADTVKNGNFRIWQVAITIQAVLWVFAVACVSDAKVLRERGGRNLIGAVVLTAMLFLPVIVYQLQGEIAASKAQPVFPFNVLLGSIAIGFLSWGMLRTHDIARRRAATESAEVTAEVETYLQLHRLLGAFLSFTGGIIALGFFGSHAHSLSTRELDEGAKVLSLEHLFVWALYSSALLGIVFLAARSALIRWGERIRLTLCPWPENADGWDDWFGRRSNVNDALMLMRSPFAEFHSLFGVLAPLAGSLISSLLPEPG